MKTVPLVLLAFLATMLAACCSATPPAAPPPAVDMRTHAERAEALSVALLGPSGDPNCGGVWISRTQIITKSHCVAGAGRPAIYDMEEALGLDMHLPKWNPEGQKVRYQMKGEPARESVVQAIDTDPSVDLAILNVAPSMDVPRHDIAYVSDRMLRDGEDLDVVGSTVGEAFTYSHCYVANGGRQDWLQVAGPVFFGNSGGGAFDERGALVGIADHIRGKQGAGWVPGMSFFSTGRALREFIAASASK